MSSTCYFDPTKGQLPNITPSGAPTERSLPSVPDVFGSCFVLAVIVISILIMYCLCQKKETNILVVGINEPTTQTERSQMGETERNQMEEMKSNSHLSLKYSLYVSTVALAVVLLLIPSWREEFSDSVWVIVYFLALFSFLLLSLNYSHNNDLNHGVRSSQSVAITASSVSLMLSTVWTAWIPLALSFYAGFELYMKRTRLSSVFVKQMLINAILAAEFYAVTESKNCNVVFQTVTLWIWYSLLLAVGLITVRKGDAGTIISAVSIALYAA